MIPREPDESPSISLPENLPIFYWTLSSSFLNRVALREGDRRKNLPGMSLWQDVFDEGYRGGILIFLPLKIPHIYA